MRYLIISYDDYFNIPYIKYYEQQLQAHGQDYAIALWDRSGQGDAPANAFLFRGKDRSGKLHKLSAFLQWRRFVLGLLKKGNYDRLIVLTTIPGILLADRLLGRYRGRYWLDIRDYTYEYLPPYQKLLAALVRASAFTSISSEAFADFLPEGKDYVLTHNISNTDAAESRCSLCPSRRPVTIGFVGGVQYARQNKCLLQALKNDGGYRLRYVGKVHLNCDLEPYCREQGIENAEFFPAYRNEEKPEIYRSIDLINSIYGGGSKIVQLALPNKLYDCILFKKPILVSKGTYLSQVVERYRLGLALDVERDDIRSELENYLAGFDAAAFEAGCRELLEKVMQETEGCRAAMEDFCRGED